MIFLIKTEIVNSTESTKLYSFEKESTFEDEFSNRFKNQKNSIKDLTFEDLKIIHELICKEIKNKGGV